MPTINFAAPKRKLTIGMCVIQDYNGVYFTIQSLLLHHPEIIPYIELIVIDNDPESIQGMATKDFCEKWVKKVPIQYIPFTEYRATSLRNKIFDYAKTNYVLVCDSHVLFPTGAIRKLIHFFDSGKDEGNLIQGPLIMDNLQDLCSHFKPVWEDQMLGKWDFDPRGNNPDVESFEIPGQGFGVFACRKDSWLRICDDNRGFGGEEICINKVFSHHGKRTLCLNDLKWVHRFRYKQETIPYPLILEERVKNYFREFKRFGGDDKEIIEHFLLHGETEETLLRWKREATSQTSLDT